MTTRQQIDQALAPLALAYPQHYKQFDDRSADALRALYHRILSDIDGALLEAAVAHWLSQSKPFHPSPGELREMSYNLKSNRLSAEEAWGVLQKAISVYGSYRTPQFDDALVARTVKIMGWRELCLSENIVADRAHFFRVYDSLAARQKNDDLMLLEVRRTVDQLQTGRARGILGALAEKMKR